MVFPSKFLASNIDLFNLELIDVEENCDECD
jgi:hypothetical protein